MSIIDKNIEKAKQCKTKSDMIACVENMRCEMDEDQMLDCLLVLSSQENVYIDIIAKEIEKICKNKIIESEIMAGVKGKER
jgi:hypothetical protein